MTNLDRQRSLVRQYGKMGDYVYCEFCSLCKNTEIIKKCLESDLNNCKHNFDSFGTPCATAYNRMIRRK